MGYSWIRSASMLLTWPTADLEIAYTHHANISYRFVHDLRAATDLRKAVQLARRQLLQDANRLKCNVLISEG